MDFFWLLKRLSVMSPREIFFRCGEIFTLLLMRLKYLVKNRTVENPLKYNFLKNSQEQFPAFKWKKPNLDFESNILKGILVLFHRGKKWKIPDGKKRWLTAPDTSKIWDEKFFGDIKFRQGSSVGDIRVLWEPARLQHLIAISISLRNTQNELNKQELVKNYIDHILSFDKLNRQFKGPHYVSSMECSLRIISILISYDLGRDFIIKTNKNPNHILEKAVANIVIGHANFVYHRLSLHSSAGNHILAEATGLFLAGYFFSEHKMAKKWSSVGLDLFTKHIDRQIDESGWGNEGSTWYLQQILDYAHIIIMCLEYREQNVPKSLLNAYKRGAICHELLKKRIGSYPIIGDSDSGWAVSELFLRDSEKKISIDDSYCSNFTRATVAGNGTGLSALINYGDLGMGPTFGHGHAHALAVAMYSDGTPVLTDPGTYSYTGHPEMRRYFRSTSAHNTVSVNRKDQAKQELLFMWSKPYECKPLLAEQIGSIVAVFANHNGYEDDGVRHHRLFLFDPKFGLFVEDWLRSKKSFSYDLAWNVNGKIKDDEILIAKSVLDYKIVTSNESRLSITESPISDSYHQSKMHPRIEVSSSNILETNIQSHFSVKSIDKSWYKNARKQALKKFSEIIN